ncbi:hypothetical protein [Rossellomorea sp. SC111]|uniref:hypothetical protein n=1 Tax=Rossellomorea sp. SC111 TaxID=2968985 RepID=UPI00215A375B|nr:hypothetical protein [Rossellomorea sp. SC111]
MASLLGFGLLMAGPIVGGVLAFGILAGCLFRGLYLLSDIHRGLVKDLPRQDKAKEVYEEYLRRREE